MKKYIALACLLSLTMAAQNHDRACDIFGKINTLLQERHYKPKPVNDSLSAYVFNSVMEQLDDNHTLFLKDEYDRLAVHKYKLDDYIIQGNCGFFTDFISAYKKALERNKTFTNELIAGNLDLNTKDTIFYSRKTFPYHTDPQKIKRFIRKKMVYDVLEDIAMQSQDRDSLKTHFEKLSADAKKKVSEAFLCRVNSLLSPPEGFDNSIYNRFFSTFSSYFDPHSTYFNYNEKSSFMSSISSENYSLGLYVSQDEKDNIVVEEIVPGGPAYNSQKVDKGDQLLKIAAGGKEYSVNCSSLEAITNIVLSDTYKDVAMTFRKKDGKVYTVTLRKVKMNAEEHKVFSYILGGEQNIGYIKIPSFYTAVDNAFGRGSADDVARELKQLKKSRINGLIIDLQFNGGGSMEEVIRMAGMFIDYGPVAVISDKQQDYAVINDEDRGTLYRGPMVVLVNGQSASASEFFAGVMQDYNRAVIAGSTTLGKASMQTILQLKGSKEDFVKLTIDKFYRVTGNSSQYTGIVPDVEMPSFFEKLMPRESSMPNALKNDSIALDFTFKKLPKDPITYASGLSKTRVSGNSDFTLVNAINDKVDKLYNSDKPALPLTFDTVFDDVHSMDMIWKDITTATEKDQHITVNTTYAAVGTSKDDFAANTNAEKIKAIKTNPYIREAMNIAADLYNLGNN
ncbi:MAG: S41 family peptidase [Flavobacterium sp.]